MLQMFDRMPTPLRVFINQYGYISLPLLPVLVLIIILGAHGFTLAGLAILAVVALALVVFWLRTHARQTPNAPQSTGSLLEEIKSSGKYAMLAFESEFCLSSTRVGQQLSDLESRYPKLFQVYALSVLKEPGKDLFKKYRGRVTPTYVLLDGDGRVVMDWPLVLPVERISYEVKRQSQEMARVSGV